MTSSEFEHIVRRLRPLLLRMATDFFRNREDAEDAVQEVLLHIWLRPWQPGDNLDALAVRAIKNQCISMQRKQLLRRTDDLDHEARSTPGSDDSDIRLRAEEQAAHLERAISRLPKAEQRLIRLKQQEMEADEIAVITGTTVHSVRTMLASARRKLIQYMTP